MPDDRWSAPWRRAMAALGSVRVAAALIAVIATVVALATVYERAYGATVASVMIYQSWWFAALFAVLALCLAAAVLARLPLARRLWGFALAHLGLIVLIAGFWAAGRERLDGLLEAPPGVEAARIALPYDEVVVVEGDRRWRAAYQPIRDAHYPSLPAFLAYDLWADPPPFISRLRPPRLLLDADGARVAVAAVLDTGAAELGFGPGDGPPAVLVALDGGSGGARQPIARGWLSPAGETILDQGLVLVSLGVAGLAASGEDFLAAQPPAAEDGELVVEDGGRLRRVEARPGAELALADGRTLVVERTLERPRPFDGGLVEDGAARVDPVAVYRWRTADGRMGEPRYAPAYLLPPPLPGEPLVRYEHPALHRGAGDGSQGLALQLLVAPGAEGRPRLLARWCSRARGLGGAVAVERTWHGALLDGPAMRLGATLHWLPAAEPAPEPVAMAAGQQERAARWLKLRVEAGGSAEERWLRRDSGAAVRVGGRELLIHYRRAAYDLRERHGFAIRLERFDEGKDPGGQRSASYASAVTVLPDGGDPWPALITMNQPLTVRGVTLYQTAFRPELDDAGRPTGRQVSVLTAATDRGRPLKYLGSALLVAGIALHFLLRRSPA